MTSKINAARQPDTITIYVDSLAPVKARADAGGAEAGASLALLGKLVIASEAQYAECAALAVEFNAKVKLLDEERMISVSPLNTEVKRVNDWFRPGIEGGRAVVDKLKTLMSGYLLKQKAEQRRLEAEAQEAARKLLATSPNVTLTQGNKVGGDGAAEVQLLVRAADAAMPNKVQGVADKPMWTWELGDATLLAREFLCPDLRAIAAHVAKHGDKNVPAGVVVKESIAFRMSAVKRGT